ncbi:hypothetical protein DFO63_1807 [Stenotrophomonas sp. AG209]|nr:hypothetical protein DFO63_1807 [Stenotrophomonas sp. AG209]
MCAHAVRPTPDPVLDAIRERLQQQYALHQRGALFWTAYQGLQLELVRGHPLDHERLCATRWPTSPKTSVRSSTRN